jgi:hypothetical protein
MALGSQGPGVETTYLREGQRWGTTAHVTSERAYEFPEF